MSRQVDVLSELDRRIEIGELFGQEHNAPNLPGVASLREARAVVAELIEAGNRVTDAFRVLGVATPRTRSADNARYECEEAMLALDAALARCKGGSNG